MEISKSPHMSSPKMDFTPSKSKKIDNHDTHKNYSKNSKYPREDNFCLYPYDSPGRYHPGEILSDNEKRKFCNNLNDVRRRDLSLTFPMSDCIRDVKSMDTFESILHGTRTKKSEIVYGVISENIIDGECGKTKQVRMALKIQSNTAVSVGRFLWKVYKIFPHYHYKIQIQLSDTSVYLDKARDLVSPLLYKHGGIFDMNPFVYGESLYDLLKRFENSSKGAKRSIDISTNWSPDLIRAARDSSGCQLKFITSGPYKELHEMYPFQCRSAFDKYSNISDTSLLPCQKGFISPHELNVYGDYESIILEEKERQRLKSIEEDRKAMWGDLLNKRHDSEKKARF